MADLRLGARWLITPDEGEGGEAAPPTRWDRLPAFLAACFVILPAAMVPVMGFGAIATSAHGVGWQVITGLVAGVGSLGVLMVIGGGATALGGVRSPVPALLVAGGTTVALAAGILLAPVLMAGLAV
jgi:hypothetical protein